MNSESNARAIRDLDVRQKAGHYQGLFKAMGSPCEMLVETDDKDLALKLLRTVAKEAWRVEAKFSRYLPNNIIAQINQGAGQPVTVDEETANLLDFAETLYQLSNKRFDITSGVLRKVWTFDGTDQVPSTRHIEGVLDKLGWHKVSWARPIICLQTDMQIDFGGIAKEYAVDKAASLLANETSCGCLVNFGGDLAIVGNSRSARGWQVGIEALDNENAKAQKRISLKTGALATSGDSRRYVLRNGKRYGHILNPLTGWPIEGAPRSITVAAGNCTQAGMLATLAMLRGAEAETFLESQDTQFWCLR